jgi:hypothetical protein
MAQQSFQLKGINSVMKNLNREFQAIQGRSLSGMMAAAAYVRRDMSKTSPTVPIDYRNLDHSWFIVTAKSSKSTPAFTGDDAEQMAAEHAAITQEYQGIASGKKSPVLVMGFSANYASFVHEMPNSVNWSKEGSGSKFFESAIDRNTAKMLEIIGNYAKIK